MQIALSEAKGQLLDLVRRAEGGEDIILTRDGQAIARLVGLASDTTERRSALLEARGSAVATPDVTADRSQDFLYDDAGLPG